ncbi:hypothetical protein KQI65_15965 [bacterium]|nr:hypothetical protein [bacterium]
MTVQIKDRITYGDRSMRLISIVRIPHRRRRIQRVALGEKSLLWSTACWRRYIAFWQVEDEKLFLTGFDGIYRLTGDGPMFADWVSGELRLAGGDEMEYTHDEHYTRYEHEVSLLMEDGRVARVLEEKHYPEDWNFEDADSDLQ